MGIPVRLLVMTLVAWAGLLLLGTAPAAAPTARADPASTRSAPAPIAPAPIAPPGTVDRARAPAHESLPPVGTPNARAGVPRPWTGGATGCVRSDPTSEGCLTGATRHGLEAVADAFGGWSHGPVIRSAGCWDEHAWNPSSDHPRGRACDLFLGPPGRFPRAAEREAGWRVARWFRTHAEALQVRYVIWQGRYWDPRVPDEGGWGRRYRGGGLYDVREATGGHFDHVHVSFRE